MKYISTVSFKCRIYELIFMAKKQFCIRQIKHWVLNACANEFKGAEDYDKQT